MTQRSANDSLEQFKWLRGGVLAVHAMVNTVDFLDETVRKRFDWSALAYLTEQMQDAVLSDAFAEYIDELEERVQRELRDRRTEGDGSKGEELPATVTGLMEKLRESLDRASTGSKSRPRTSKRAKFTALSSSRKDADGENQK
jgi:hypothetical protein